MKKRADKNNGNKNKSGSALLIALVIMMVVMMLSLVLLLVSYSLYSTANKQNNTEQCKEIAQSLSKEIEKEITDVTFSTYAEQSEALSNGKNQLWFYLRYNVWRSSWPYYNADEPIGHSANHADRYFKIAADSTVDTSILDNTSIMMYWKSEKNANSDEKSDTELVVQITCTKGKQKATITTNYILEVGEHKYSDESIPDEDNGNLIINPSMNRLSAADLKEIWVWSFSERE